VLSVKIGIMIVVPPNHPLLLAPVAIKTLVITGAAVPPDRALLQALIIGGIVVPLDHALLQALAISGIVPVVVLDHLHLQTALNQSSTRSLQEMHAGLQAKEVDVLESVDTDLTEQHMSLANVTVHLRIVMEPSQLIRPLKQSRFVFVQI
jgi:hypothetical protein